MVTEPIDDECTSVVCDPSPNQIIIDEDSSVVVPPKTNRLTPSFSNSVFYLDQVEEN